MCGRIGELYAALITNGQMATETNQKGYDVVSGDGERISVKTTAKMESSGHVAFNPNTLDQVDRVIILRMNTEEMQIETLFNDSVEAAKELMAQERDGKRVIALSKLLKSPKPASEQKTVNSVSYKEYEISELESGTIEVRRNGEFISPAKPILRQIAKAFGVSILNSNGNKLNTRQLGSYVIKAISESNKG